MKAVLPLKKSLQKLLLSLVLTGSTVLVMGQMNGTYLINGVSNYPTSFATFQEAADSLASLGVSGPVVIDVAAGEYDEQIEIYDVPGSSATNTITFKAESGDSTEVVLKNSLMADVATNHIIKLIGANWVILQEMTFDGTAGSESYGTAIKFRDDADSNTVRNCVFEGEEGTASLEYKALIHAQYSSYDNRGLINDYITIENNVFRKGDIGLFFSSYNNSLRHRGIKITNNQFVNQAEVAIYCFAGQDITVTGNIIDIEIFDGSGIDINDVDNANRITGNKLNLLNPGFGIRVRNSTASAASEASKGLIANNFVSLGGSNGGLGLAMDIVDNYRIYHNSVNINASSTNDATRAFSLTGGGSSGMDVRNNIFANYAAGYAYYVGNSGTIDQSDYNNYFTFGNYLAYWVGEPAPALSDLRTLNTLDPNSITVNPIWFSETDLHTTNFHLESKGQNDADIKTAVPADIDGETWGSNPDIGADEFIGAGTAMAGVYTIGGTNPDFATIAEAVDSLNEVGISTNVVFHLRDGAVYEEQVQIYPVSGSARDKRVKFMPDPGNNDPVVITHESTAGANYTIKMIRASYVDFHDLTINATNDTYPVVLRLTGMTSNDSISGCTLTSTGTTGNSAAVFSNGALVDSLHIYNNTIQNGYTGIWIDGPDDDNLNPTDITIVDNNIDGHYWNGVYLRDCNAPLIEGNTFSNGFSSSNYYGVYLYRCINDFKILKNQILVNHDNGGIHISASDGTVSFRGKIINNYIGADQSLSNAIYGIHTESSDYVDVFYNTVYIAKDNTSTSSRAYYNSNGSNLKVKNNNFVNFGEGYAYYNNATNAISESDYNNLYTAGIYLAYWDNNKQQISLDGLRSVNGGLETHSYNLAAYFNDASMPDINSIFLDTAGVDLASDPDSPVADDIYGTARTATPSIGAFQYTSGLTPVAGGTYQIGAGLSAPNYASITGALGDLQSRGISGPIVLEILPGEYEEYIGKVFKIPGSSETNRITLTSESGNREDVTIFFATDNGDFQNIFHFIGVDHFTIRDLTIASTNSSYGRPLNFTSTFMDLRIENCEITSNNTSYDAVRIEDGIASDVVIRNNRITRGRYGIIMEGSSSENYYSEGTLIEGNQISLSGNSGMYIRYQLEPMVIANTITNENEGGFYGIQMHYCTEEMIVTGNRIYSMDDGYGIYLYNCDATVPTFYGLVSNNVIHFGGNYYAYGIRLNNCTGTKLYHNSIYLTSTHNTPNYTLGIYAQSNNASLIMKNNSSYNAGKGYAYYVEDGSDIEASDFNNFFTSTTESLAYWDGTDYTSLTTLQAASGMDANSLELDPRYVSTGDLTSGQPGLYKKATPVPEVTVDIDSVARDASNPDIGAIAFTCETPVFDLITTIGCEGDSTIIIDNSTGIAPGSAVGYDFTDDGTVDVWAAGAGDTISYLFPSSGVKPVSYQVNQIAGCVDSYDFDIEVVAPPEFEIITQGAYCDTNDGSAIARVIGDGDYNYFWSNGSTDTIAEGLALGSYTVAVSDTNGCTTDTTFTIGEAIQLQLAQLKPSTCGVDDGAAYVTATGGFGPYTYAWDNGETSDTNRTLRAGVNYVNVIDSKGCYAQGSINIANDGTGPQIELNSLVHNDCNGDRLGSIDISVSGGNAPYDILWSNGAGTEDIDSIAAGIYNVVVTDADGCQGAASYQITQPSAIAVSPVVEPATCAGSDGSAVAVVSGGTAPYIYKWSNGGIYQIAEGLAAGVYSVTVTDAKGCQTVEPVLVSNVNAPQVTVTEVQGTGCSVTDNGAIDISVTGGVPGYNYLWSPGGMTTQDVSGLSNGTYQVQVTDFNGCVGVASAVIATEPPAVNPICLVTVDTTTGTNLIVWEKTVSTDVSHYNIYRESNVRGEYQLIGSRPYDSLSLFTDTLADPTVRSWRYRLSVVDDCGNESELSMPHKTIHLTLNVGLNDAVNLIWDNYEGFNVPTYDIYKYLPASGWNNLTSIAADDDNSYTDANVTEDDVFYYVQVVAPDDGCTATAFKATSLNSSRSNRKGKQLQTTGIESMIDLSQLNIYPNPSSGLFNLRMSLEASDEVEMKVYDISGKMVIHQRYENLPSRLETRFDLSPFADGIYQVHLKSGNVFIQRMIIKE